MQPARWVLALSLLVAAIGIADAGHAARPRQEINVTLQDRDCPAGPDRFCVLPSNVSLAEKTDLVINVENEGRIEHRLAFANGTPDALAKHGMNTTLAPNETGRISVPWPSVKTGFESIDGANVTLVDPQPGHAELGERFTVEVPSMAAEQRRQPGPGVAAVLVLAGVALVARAREL